MSPITGLLPGRPAESLRPRLRRDRHDPAGRTSQIHRNPRTTTRLGEPVKQRQQVALPVLVSRPEQDLQGEPARFDYEVEAATGRAAERARDLLAPFLLRPVRHRRSPATSPACRPPPAAPAAPGSPAETGRAATTPPCDGGRSHRSVAPAPGRAPLTRACRCRARTGSPPSIAAGCNAPGRDGGSDAAGRPGSPPTAPTSHQKPATATAVSVPHAADVNDQIEFS